MSLYRLLHKLAYVQTGTTLQPPPEPRLSSLIIGNSDSFQRRYLTPKHCCRTASSSGTTRPATRGGISPARTSPCPTSTLCATRTPTSTSPREISKVHRSGHYELIESVKANSLKKSRHQNARTTAAMYLCIYVNEACEAVWKPHASRVSGLP